MGRTPPAWHAALPCATSALVLALACGDPPAPPGSTQVDAVEAPSAAGEQRKSAPLHEPGPFGLARRRDAGPGRWKEVVLPDAAQRAAIERLQAIGYLRGSARIGDEGVTIHDTERATAGANLYSSGHGPEAVLMDMDGRVLHRWRREYLSALPPPALPSDNMQWFRRVHVYPNGDLLAIFEGLGLVKLDRRSEVLWAVDNGAHHDLEVDGGGDVWVLTRVAHVVPRINSEAPILEDFVTVVDGDTGVQKRRISLLEAFEASEFVSLVGLDGRPKGDIFHTNTLFLLDGTLADRAPAFSKGRVLVSLNRPRTLAVLDPDLGRIVWARTLESVGVHDPKTLANGNLLVFENRQGTGSSAVVERDPVDLRAVWTHRGTPEKPFSSTTCGAAERLEQGNTLITESDNGRAFEVTPAGELVWEFYNPHRAGPEREFIATLSEVVRLPPDFPVDWALGDDAPSGGSAIGEDARSGDAALGQEAPDGG